VAGWPQRTRTLFAMVGISSEASIPRRLKPVFWAECNGASEDAPLQSKVRSNGSMRSGLLVAGAAALLLLVQAGCMRRRSAWRAWRRDNAGWERAQHCVDGKTFGDSIHGSMKCKRLPRGHQGVSASGAGGEGGVQTAMRMRRKGFLEAFMRTRRSTLARAATGTRTRFFRRRTRVPAVYPLRNVPKTLRQLPRHGRHG